MSTPFRLRVALSMWTGVLVMVTGTPLGFAQGTIAYFRPSQAIVVAFDPNAFPPVFYEFDVDQNGTIDYRFDLADGLGVSVEPTGANRQIAVPEIPPDMGSELDPLPAGFEVAASLTPGYQWVSQESPNRAGHSFLSACADIGCIGLFHGQDAYMGIEFQRGDDIHYGWVHINNPAGQAGGYILDWAYETQPGVPILAGAVPEPSTWALLVGGGVLMVWFKRKRNERRG